jgi:hypothetical protein
MAGTLHVYAYTLTEQVSPEIQRISGRPAYMTSCYAVYRDDHFIASGGSVGSGQERFWETELVPQLLGIVDKSKCSRYALHDGMESPHDKHGGLQVGKVPVQQRKTLDITLYNCFQLKR